MKTFARSTLALGISLALVSAANANDFADMDPVTLRLAHVVNEQDGFHIA
ncbi:MAG TPA: C4-dicarboxylate ABC transporter substrate-binding protein, partial [Halomonas sp.]|nr:C4-dicarboxylate ABC transporter substrate-binding protein [Halomonas sp.]